MTRFTEADKCSSTEAVVVAGRVLNVSCLRSNRWELKDLVMPYSLRHKKHPGGCISAFHGGVPTRSRLTPYMLAG